MEQFDINLLSKVLLHILLLLIKLKGHGRMDKLLACPAVICTCYCFSDENIFSILRLDNDIVNHVPVFKSHVSERSFKFVLLLERSVCDDKLVFHTFDEQEGSI